jgi:hypothetical protein
MLAGAMLGFDRGYAASVVWAAVLVLIARHDPGVRRYDISLCGPAVSVWDVGAGLQPGTVSTSGWPWTVRARLATLVSLFFPVCVLEK